MEMLASMGHAEADEALLRLAHADCGAEATVEIRCAEGHEVPADELVVRVGSR